MPEVEMAQTAVNDSRTGSGFDTPLTQPRSLDVPANFDLYRRRQELIAKRNASADPVKREQINILIEQLTNYDRATGVQRLALATAIQRQMQLVAF